MTILELLAAKHIMLDNLQKLTGLDHHAGVKSSSWNDASQTAQACMPQLPRHLDGDCMLPGQRQFHIRQVSQLMKRQIQRKTVHMNNDGIDEKGNSICNSFNPSTSYS